MITLNSKFKPILRTPKRYVLVTGGRGGGKSFSIQSLMCLLADQEDEHKILVMRYTMKSAHLSIIPEFTEKIDLLGLSSRFAVNKTDVTNKATNSQLMFRGIKTSEGIQTANLKSIQGVTTLVFDEAEEIRDEETFDKIDLSVRTKGKRNIVFIILNPTDTEHWIYKRWIKDTHKVEVIDNTPVQISTHPEVLHIHLTYLDNLQYLSESYIDRLQAIKNNNLDKYERIVIGKWSDSNENAIIKKDWFEYVAALPKTVRNIDLWVDGAYTKNTANDPTGLMITGYDVANKMLYVLFAKDAYMELPELVKEVERIKARYLKASSRIYIEPKASGKSLKQVLHNQGHNAIEIKSKLVAEGKHARAEVIALYAESSRIKLLQGNWNEMFVNQVSSFPIASHDEYIDLLGYACDKYLSSSIKAFSVSV